MINQLFLILLITSLSFSASAETNFCLNKQSSINIDALLQNCLITKN